MEESLLGVEVPHFSVYYPPVVLQLLLQVDILLQVDEIFYSNSTPILLQFYSNYN